MTDVPKLNLKATKLYKALENVPNQKLTPSQYQYVDTFEDLDRALGEVKFHKRDMKEAEKRAKALAKKLPKLEKRVLKEMNKA